MVDRPSEFPRRTTPNYRESKSLGKLQQASTAFLVERNADAEEYSCSRDC